MCPCLNSRAGVLPSFPAWSFWTGQGILGFMKFVVSCRREPQNFQNCFALKKKKTKPKMCCCCSHLCSAPGGVPAQPPSAAFVPWA